MGPNIERLNIEKDRTSKDLHRKCLITVFYYNIDLIRGSVIRGSIPFEVQSFEVWCNARFGPFRGSVIRGSVTFELRSFEVRSNSRFSHSRFGLLRFGLSRFSLSKFGLLRLGHSRFSHGFDYHHRYMKLTRSTACSCRSRTAWALPHQSHHHCYP
jgi:hypothetical protein